MEPEGTLKRIGSAQSRILVDLLDGDRLARLSDYEALAGKAGSGGSDVYPVPELLADVQRGIWSELASSQVTIDPFRRSLQRAYLAQADGKINPQPAIIISSSRRGGASRVSVGGGPNSDVRALMRGELTDLDAALRAAIPRASNRETRLHLLDARAEIKQILEPGK